MVWSTPEVREVCVGMEVTELPVRGDVISHRRPISKAGGVNSILDRLKAMRGPGIMLLIRLRAGGHCIRAA